MKKEDDEVMRYPTSRQRWTASSATSNVDSWAAGRPVPSPFLVFETSTLGLDIDRLGPEHLINGQMILTCTAQFAGETHHGRSTTVRVEQQQEIRPGHQHQHQYHSSLLFLEDSRSSHKKQQQQQQQHHRLLTAAAAAAAGQQRQ